MQVLNFVMNFVPPISADQIAGSRFYGEIIEVNMAMSFLILFPCQLELYLLCICVVYALESIKASIMMEIQGRHKF